MNVKVLAAFVLCCTIAFACGYASRQSERRQPGWSGWIEETAAARGYVKPGDIGQFSCPPGWSGVEDTMAALRGRQVSTVYMGTDAPSRDGTITCVAQAESALPLPYGSNVSDQPPLRQPLAPVWVDIGADSITIGFRSELPLSAAVYFGRDTPCGPRVIGVRLGDLLTWLVDPQAATKRDFLGMVSGGCPEQDRLPQK